MHQIDSSHARVDVTFAANSSYGGYKMTMSPPVIVENGSWKVCPTGADTVSVSG